MYVRAAPPMVTLRDVFPRIPLRVPHGPDPPPPPPPSPEVAPDPPLDPPPHPAARRTHANRPTDDARRKRSLDSKLISILRSRQPLCEGHPCRCAGGAGSAPRLAC